MPRMLLLFAALGALAAASTAEARLFWQTYGSVVPTEGGGCAWNMNSDYFVPRHCDSGRYGLFSPCKTAHTRSAACRNLHPIYQGYCSPYGSWHYRWRDHVYKTFCGCCPLKYTYGPWHVDRCTKHPLVLKHHKHGCSKGHCGMGTAVLDMDHLAAERPVEGYVLPNVEPMGGVTLGTVAALPSAMLGGGGGAAAVAPRASTGMISVGAPGSPAGQTQFPAPAIPKIPVPGNGALPAPLGF